jgi:hypothetical protein
MRQIMDWSKQIALAREQYANMEGPKTTQILAINPKAMNH